MHPMTALCNPVVGTGEPLSHGGVATPSVASGRRRFTRVRWSLTLLMLLVATRALQSGDSLPRMYRWVDEGGVVHYTDQIPPSQVDKGHVEFSKQGVQVERVPPSQTLDEIQHDRELERLRAQQERLVEQQRAADRVLLRTFRSIDDLLMARDGKFAAIDVVIQIARGNIRRQQDGLRTLYTDAANLERAGKPVPQHLSDAINKTERQIRDSYATIVDREQQKEAIRAEFDRDIKRFLQLKDLPADKVAEPPEPHHLALRNLVICADDAQCNQYWARAVAYVQAHATTPIQASGSNIVITAPPQTHDDLGLTLSRIQEKTGSRSSIFLDLQCKNQTEAVVAACNTERSAAVLNGFRDAVTGAEAERASPLKAVP
jgi:hypothetical protein